MFLVLLRYTAVVVFSLVYTQSLHAYAFTSSEGESFEGELLSYDSEQAKVTVRRSSDRLTFTLPVARFAEVDQDYFRLWQAEKAQEALVARAPKRILFVGNSYTLQIRSLLKEALSESPYHQTEFDFVAQGGATLQWHMRESGAMRAIKEEEWDIVVLQEQSQTPALLGSAQEGFFDAVSSFDDVIKRSGAETYLYQTWGRRDGDPDNPELFPTYERMQVLLTDSYEKAARRARLTIVPVGDVWQAIRSEHEDLGDRLYQRDGSHPSKTGAYLACATFFRTIFKDDLSYFKEVGRIEEKDAHAILETVLKMVEVE